MKTLLTFFILLFSSSVLAEWVFFSEDEELTLYTRYDNITKNDGYIYYWTLFDFNPPIEETIGSLIFLHQGECYPYKSKILRSVFYREQMGSGEILKDDTIEEDWKFLIPDSNEYLLLESICSKFN